MLRDIYISTYICIFTHIYIDMFLGVEDPVLVFTCHAPLVPKNAHLPAFLAFSSFPVISGSDNLTPNGNHSNSIL